MSRRFSGRRWGVACSLCLKAATGSPTWAAAPAGRCSLNTVAVAPACLLQRRTTVVTRWSGTPRDAESYAEELVKALDAGPHVQRGLMLGDVAALPEQVEAAESAEGGIPGEAAEHGEGTPRGGAAVALLQRSNQTLENATAQQLGFAANAEGDLAALMKMLGISAGFICLCILFISTLRSYIPLVYQHKATAARICVALPPAAEELPSSFFGWLTASYRLKVADAIVYSGLDQAMLLEFTHLAMLILGFIGVPSLAVLCPLHLHGGGGARDNLSRLGFGNVARGSWVCWVHCVFVWYVVLVVELFIFRAMRLFMARRIKWLREMPPPRSTTVLVEELPEGMNTAAKLRRYFDERVFGQRVVKEVNVVKDTSNLVAALNKLEQSNLQLEREQSMVNSAKKGSIVTRNSAAAAQQQKCAEQVERLKCDIERDDSLNMRSAFVTFHERREAIVALKIFGEADEEVIACVPPDPVDVDWEGFTALPQARSIRQVIGQSLIAGLLLGFMPMVVGVASVMSLETMRTHIPVVGAISDKYPTAAAIWDGFMGSVALTIMMSFLPSLLALIFRSFWTIKSGNELQLKIQDAYFYFLVVFVLLVTAITAGIISTLHTLLEHPPKLFALLATTLPQFTNFYLKYFIVQCAGHALTATRYTVLLRYLFYVCFFPPLRARDLAEPEHQDHDGMGSRGARCALVLVMALVFSTLCPLILPVGLANFALCRMFYGHLLVHAETVKPDLGGDFWILMIQHVQLGLFLYIVLMTGVLLERASSFYPGMLAISSLALLYYCHCRLRQDFRCHSMAFMEAMDTADPPGRPPTRASYRQPELPAPPQPREQPPASTMHIVHAGLQQALQDVSKRLALLHGLSSREEEAGAFITVPHGQTEEDGSLAPRRGVWDPEPVRREEDARPLAQGARAPGKGSSKGARRNRPCS